MSSRKTPPTSPDTGSPAGSVSGDRRSRPAARSPRATGRRRPPSARALIDTTGPNPETSLDDVFLTIGTIAGTHGVGGELKLRVVSDRPEHILTLTRIYLGDREDPVPLLSARKHGDQLLIRLKGVTTPEAGKMLGGLRVRARASDLAPLEPGEYYLYQLIGLSAQSPDGSPLGTVTDLIETGANDVLVISQSGAPDLLVPNHPNYVREIAPERSLIVIEPPVYS